MAKDSKAARIRRMLAEGMGSGEIAKAVGCMPDYVRVVRQRQEGGGARKCDRAVDPEKRRAWHRRRYHERYQHDPEYRRKHIEAARANRQRKKAAKEARNAP